MLRVTNLKRYFDVSASFLVRVLEHQPRQILKAVDGVSFEIRKGETFSLVGESGCGNRPWPNWWWASILRQPAILNSRHEHRGDDTTKDGSFTKPSSNDLPGPLCQPQPRWRSKDIISEPIRAFGLAKGNKAVDERVGELLRHVRLTPEDGQKYPHEFSGGQRQRISIARPWRASRSFSYAMSRPPRWMSPSRRRSSI